MASINVIPSPLKFPIPRPQFNPITLLGCRVPENVLGWKIDPCPDWIPDGLFSELKALESKFSAVSLLSKEKSRDVSGGVRIEKGFAIRVGKGEGDGLDDEVVREKEEVGLSPGYRFGFDDLYVRRALEEAAEIAKENSTLRAAVENFGKGDDALDPSSNVPPSDAPGKSESLGGGSRAAESALKDEEKRRLNYEELYKNIQTWMSSSNKDISSHERKISRVIRQISGSVENVRAKAKELLKILSDPGYPQFVSMVILAKKVPQLMDILVAELHRVCIYTVPKHVVFSKSAFEERNVYFKAIGYREEDGKMEETDRYLARLESCMNFIGH
ncbi:mRNA export factor GLE1-like protein [Drosera capensis]